MALGLAHDLRPVSSGIEIKGRKLRLRWGENTPTTPEVDEFHRAPERFKTRPCYEVYKNLTCPRGHIQFELNNGELKFGSGDFLFKEILGGWCQLLSSISTWGL